MFDVLVLDALELAVIEFAVVEFAVVTVVLVFVPVVMLAELVMLSVVELAVVAGVPESEEQASTNTTGTVSVESEGKDRRFMASTTRYQSSPRCEHYSAAHGLDSLVTPALSLLALSISLPPLGAHSHDSYL